MNRIHLHFSFLVLFSFYAGGSLLFSQNENEKFKEIVKVPIHGDLSEIWLYRIVDSIEYQSFSSERFPIYVIDSLPMNIVISSLNSYAKRNLILNKKIYSYQQKDSLSNLEVSVFNNVIEHQNKRIDLYKRSFNSLVSINDTLNAQLKDCVDIAERTIKRKRRDGLFTATLGGVVGGLILGVLLAD